jgi:hypothetical protein
LGEDFTPMERVLIAATKTTVMSADLCGSALPKVKDDPAGWLREPLGRVLSPQDLENVVGQRLQGRSQREMQRPAQSSWRRDVALERPLRRISGHPALQAVGGFFSAILPRARLPKVSLAIYRTLISTRCSSTAGHPLTIGSSTTCLTRTERSETCARQVWKR